jgi:hypothetical protein
MIMLSNHPLVYYKQKHKVAQLIKQNQLMAFALTERLHGSDVLASDDLSIVLGARYYLREEHNSGIFQKLRRDINAF